ncbi:hypothetical protein AB6A40_003306 [Gnathostoma spinigerum]|uniref:Uncharacterized protein n=1 Tax=Gnathostoma spinigerum TaxID=75299 RepID=A0ABD6EJ66_9BILA
MMRAVLSWLLKIPEIRTQNYYLPKLNNNNRWNKLMTTAKMGNTRQTVGCILWMPRQAQTKINSNILKMLEIASGNRQSSAFGVRFHGDVENDRFSIMKLLTLLMETFACTSTFDAIWHFLGASGKDWHFLESSEEEKQNDQGSAIKN